MSWAESVNPPTDDPDFRRRQAAERERLRRLAEAVEPPRLAVLDDVPMPEVPIEEQRYLASLMADGLREPDPWRTLADISDDPPRPPLLGVLEPDGPSLMYAPPGVGKGTTGAWMIVELQRLGMRAAIFDAERRPREWSRRVSGLGGDRAGVVYIEPVDLGREYAGRPLWDAAPAIGAILQAAGADLLLVDSVLPAVGVGEERLRSDPQTPFQYVAALDSLGIPSISFRHPPKGQPEGDPFGSMGWLAAMRLTCTFNGRGGIASPQSAAPPRPGYPRERDYRSTTFSEEGQPMSFLDRLALRQRPCAACGASFAPSRADARTCSDACRKALSRRRSAVAEAKKRDETPLIRDEPAPIRDTTPPPWSDDDEVHDADGVLWRRVR